MREDQKYCLLLGRLLKCTEPLSSEADEYQDNGLGFNIGLRMRMSVTLTIVILRLLLMMLYLMRLLLLIRSSILLMPALTFD